MQSVRVSAAVAVLGLCIAMLAIVLGSAPAAPIPAPVPGDGGQEILYQSDVEGSYDIWAINADGTNRVNLSKVEHDPSGIYSDGSGEWSPDGSTILFLSGKSGVLAKVYLMDADGTNVRPLNRNNNYEADPEWGADGAKIYYGRNPRDPQGTQMGCGACPWWEIYVCDVATGVEAPLTSNNSRDEHATPSPDGQYIVFSRAERANDCCNPTNNWIMDADGSNQTQLTPSNGRYNTATAWDPITNKIAARWMIDCGQSRCWEIVLMDPDGTYERLTNNNFPDSAEAFSPDGSMLLSGRGGDIYFFDIANRSYIPFLVEPGVQYPTDWRVANRAPEADAGPDQTVEATGPSGASVTLNGLLSSDPDDDPLTFTWMLNDEVIGDEAIITVELPIGVHEITLTVMDLAGLTDTDEVAVTVQDTTPPEITSVTATPGILWPPNHKMVGVFVSVSASDGVTAAPACSIVSAASSEPDNGLGDGDTANDIVNTGDLTLELRAERAGGGDGRIYTIELACADEAGNTAMETTTVAVPKSQGKGKK